MPFAYFKKLTLPQKAIYLRSEAITHLKLPWAQSFTPFIRALEEALKSGSQPKTLQMTQKLIDALTQVFVVEAVRAKVLERRPSQRGGELHGLYERRPGQRPVITLWMRTAKREQVVALKTYLRTLVHEVMHHLDYTLFQLEDSFHTQGFYQRESSLYRQLQEVIEPQA